MLDTTQTPRAVFSDDRQYRYTLTRMVQPMISASTVSFLMLNPSTADESKDDATIRRCIAFATAWGYGHLHVVNLSPYRATDPHELQSRGDEPAETAKINTEYVLEIARLSDKLILAYGPSGKWEGRADRMVLALRKAGVGPFHLQLTKTGYPQHPLMLRKGLVPLEWPFDGGSRPSLRGRG